MNYAVEMFSNNEVKVFGIAMLSFVLSTLFLYLTIEAAIKLFDKKYKGERFLPRYEVDDNEFSEIGNAAIREQRMKSFIAETRTGRMIEVTVDDIIEEVRRRNDSV